MINKGTVFSNREDVCNLIIFSNHVAVPIFQTAPVLLLGLLLGSIDRVLLGGVGTRSWEMKISESGEQMVRAERLCPGVMHHDARIII